MAQFSTCRQYRYALWRTWDKTKPIVLFIGLNPSTADEKNNDPTITRCINFAASWGYGGVRVANLFAYRATQPAVMKNASDPIGHDNDGWITKLAEEADLVVAAWGNDGCYLNRSATVRESITKLHCLNVNKSGEPSHPLYQRADTMPIPYEH